MLILPRTIYSLFQQNAYGVAHSFPDCLAYVCLYGQLMRAVTQSHEGASKWMTINFASYLDQPTSAKKFN